MARRRMVYEGKAKILYEGPEPGTLIQHFKDDATAFNAEKKAVIDGKGVLNNRISEHIMTALTGIGVPNHFIKRLNMREQLIRAVEIIPLEIIVRNVAAGSLSKRLGIDEGTQLPRPIIEFCLKNDDLGDPLVTEEHIIAFNWASQQDIDDIVSLSLRVNDFLSGLFMGVGIKLVDFKIECGRLYEGDFQRIILADEISPDSCRLWDSKSEEKLDKDVRSEEHTSELQSRETISYAVFCLKKKTHSFYISRHTYSFSIPPHYCIVFRALQTLSLSLTILIR